MNNNIAYFTTKGIYRALLEETVERYKHFEDIPLDQKLMLASAYLKQSLSEGDITSLQDFLDETNGDLQGELINCVESVIMPRDKIGRLLALQNLEKIIKDIALHRIDDILKSEYLMRFQPRLGDN